jgi:hypothetical protein
MNKMRTLIEKLLRLNRVYSSEINLRKQEDGNISIKPDYGFPSYEFFKTEGQNIKRIVSAERDVSFFKRVTKYQRFFNEIEIEGETRLDKGGLSHPTNPLFEILSFASNVSPTIVKYTRPDGFKKMLVCLPPDLDITTVTKKYGALISKAHHDFYRREFRERPQPISKDQKRKLIVKIRKKKFEGTRHPISRRCIVTSAILKKDYNITLSPRTLRRHYLKEIKGKVSTN